MSQLRVAVGVLLAAGALALALLLVPSVERSQLEVGFNDNAVTQGVASPGQAARLIADAGGRIDRVQIDWDRLEPVPGRYDFGIYDAIYKADLELGLRPLFIFAFAPNWASKKSCAAKGAHCPPTPDHYDDAARTAAAIADRYPKLAAIEIWNEPNIPYFWSPHADPIAYAALLEACQRAIKQANPAMSVVGGAMANTWRSGGGYLKAADFLRSVYAGGGTGVMDAISLHAYPDPADTSARSANEVIEAVRQVRDQFGETKVPIWVTETGISTTGDDAVPEEVQALVLLRLYEELRSQPGVEMVLFHTLVDPPRPPSDAETGYGIVRSDLREKPGFCALSAAWGGRAC